MCNDTSTHTWPCVTNTRTSTRRPPFVAHDLCRERWGLYTCDQRRPISEVSKDFPSCIDFDSFCPENDDTRWGKERESDESCSERGIRFLRWLSCRPERSIAVVSHSSFLRHLFSQVRSAPLLRDLDPRSSHTFGRKHTRSLAPTKHHAIVQVSIDLPETRRCGVLFSAITELRRVRRRVETHDGVIVNKHFRFVSLINSRLPSVCVWIWPG